MDTAPSRTLGLGEITEKSLVMTFFIAALKPRCGDKCDVTADVRANFTPRHGGFISSHLSGLCHGRSCPLLIRAERGQRLTITLWNFSVASKYDLEQSHEQGDACVRWVVHSFISYQLDTHSCTPVHSCPPIGLPTTRAVRRHLQTAVTMSAIILRRYTRIDTRQSHKSCCDPSTTNANELQKH